MKHHPYLQELVEQGYFTNIPIVSQDSIAAYVNQTGDVPPENIFSKLTDPLDIFTTPTIKINPIYFRGKAHPVKQTVTITDMIAIEDEALVTYIIPGYNKFLITMFTDTRGSQEYDAVLSTGVISFNNNKLRMLKNEPYGSYSLFEDAIVRITKVYNPYVRNDILLNTKSCLEKIGNVQNINKFTQH